MIKRTLTLSLLFLLLVGACRGRTYEWWVTCHVNGEVIYDAKAINVWIQEEGNVIKLQLGDDEETYIRLGNNDRAVCKEWKKTIRKEETIREEEDYAN